MYVTSFISTTSDRVLTNAGQSIGFTATLAPKDDETDSGEFLPFFTPNRRSSHNILDLVEPSGNSLSLSSTSTDLTPTDIVKYG